MSCKFSERAKGRAITRRLRVGEEDAFEVGKSFEEGNRSK
jgi:hypothetical protein